MARNFTFKVDKWGVQISNPNPYIYNAMSLPVEVISWE
jgi:hypothetical protein